MTHAFPTEAALCQAFQLSIPKDWIAYPETAGWDILLVHRVGGWQIGVEAKLALNAKVLCQAIDGRAFDDDGPDFRAVLVPKTSPEFAALARAMGITVIDAVPGKSEPDWGRRQKQGPKLPEFMPKLPETERLNRIADWWWRDREVWFDQFPTQRHRLPEYVPEVAAGVPSPMVLSDWKIKAIRVCLWVERKGSITRAQFRALGIDPSRWMTGVWLAPGKNRGVWIAGPRFPADQLRREHPNVWDKIAADWETWSQKVPT